MPTEVVNVEKILSKKNDLHKENKNCDKKRKKLVLFDSLGL